MSVQFFSLDSTSGAVTNVGREVSLFAVVTTSSATLPNGKITFTLPSDGTMDSTCGAPTQAFGSGGLTALCSFVPASLPNSGALTVTGAYSGDGNTLPSSQTLQIPLQKASTTTNVSVTSIDSPSSTQLGRTVTVSAYAQTIPSLSLPARGDLQLNIPAGVAAPGLSNMCASTSGDLGTAAIRCTFILIGPPNGAVTITANYAGDVATMPSSGGAALVTTKAQSSITPAISLSAPVYGQNFVLFANVFSSIQPGLASVGIKPTGVVTFSGNGVTTSMTVGTGASGAALPASVGPFPSPGNYSLTATYAGDENFASASAPLSFTIGKACTSTTLTPLAASTPGAPNIKVSVTPASCSGSGTPGGGTPTGVVQISSGGAVAGSVSLSNGSATLSLPTGSYSAAYGGDSNFQNSVTVGSQTVTASTIPSTVTLKVTPSQTEAMQPVTLVASVLSANAAETAAPTGSVTFTANGITVGSAILGANGCASGNACLTTPLAGGVQVIVATYGGDQIYSASNASYSLMVTKLTAMASVSAPPAVSVFGNPVILMVSVASVGGGAGVPTGMVQALDNGAPLGLPAAIANGAASLGLASLGPGSHALAAQYLGDGNFNSVTANAGSLRVVQAQTTTLLTSAANANQLLLTANVSALAPGAGVPTGDVKFVDTVTGVVLGDPTVFGGVATLASAKTTNSIAALYSGDVDFLPSASPSSSSLSAVNAASYAPAFAPGEIVTLFGGEFAAQTIVAPPELALSLGGASVVVTDNAGVPQQAKLFYVSPQQAAFLIPTQTALGKATIIATTNSGSLTASMNIAASAAALFTANANGQGPLAAQTVSTSSDGAVTYSNTTTLNGTTLANAPIPLSSAFDTYLVLYGTGFDHAGSLTVTINGESLTPTYFGPQGTFEGLDQINVLLPTSLGGSGVANISITVDGRVSNVGNVAFQ
jgi:uncharacterized protein (TIGR03437 family)